MEFEEFDIEFLALKMAENPQSMLFARLADLYLGKEQNAEAMKLLEDGIKQYPEYPAGYIVLGKAYLAFKEYSRAQTAFQRALDLSPFNQTAAKLLISVPNKPDESTRTTDENYFAPQPIPSVPTEHTEQFMQSVDHQQQEESFAEPAALTEEEPSLLAQLEAEENARLQAAGVTADPYAPSSYAEPEIELPSYEIPAAVPQQESAEPFPSYDDYFAQNQSRINSQDPVSLDEYLNSEPSAAVSAPLPFHDPYLEPSPAETAYSNDPFTSPAASVFEQAGAHVDPEPVFANPEQAALFAEMNAMNEEFSEPSVSSAPSASLDIDSLAEKLQSAEKIVPQENYQPQNPVPKETQDDQAYETDAVTPTLAEIYASQGEYRAAIQAYEILMFSVPAKGGEYQQRIRELQQLQMEKDGLI